MAAFLLSAKGAIANEGGIERGDAVQDYGSSLSSSAPQYDKINTDTNGQLGQKRSATDDGNEYAKNASNEANISRGKTKTVMSTATSTFTSTICTKTMCPKPTTTRTETITATKTTTTATTKTHTTSKQDTPMPMPKPNSSGKDLFEEEVNRVKDIFTRPLNKTEYYERNWMWMRCRTGYSNRYDVGGSWFGPEGDEWRAEIEKGCHADRWKVSYLNGKDWGDAHISFDFTSGQPLMCIQKHAVKLAQRVAEKHSERFQRKFYIWDCERPEDGSVGPTWGNERGPGGKAGYGSLGKNEPPCYITC